MRLLHPRLPKLVRAQPIDPYRAALCRGGGLGPRSLALPLSQHSRPTDLGLAVVSTMSTPCRSCAINTFVKTRGPPTSRGTRGRSKSTRVPELLRPLPRSTCSIRQECAKSSPHPQQNKNKQKQTKKTKTNRPTNKTAKMGASRSRGHVTGGKPRQALKRPFLAALRYRYLPPCSTAGRPCTGRAPVLLWSATPCWLWLAGCGLQRLSSCCKTSTTVCGYGTHIRIFLCVSVCVVSLLSALPRRRVHAVHASRIGHHVRVTCCAYIISVEVVITPACIALMIGASARGSRLNSACTP